VTLTPDTVKVTVGTNASRSRLRVNVDPNKGAGYYLFQVQKLRWDGGWVTLRRTYRTLGSSEYRIINLPRGTYRVVVLGKYGFLGTTSSSATLRR
jgi:hypothetical protein